MQLCDKCLGNIIPSLKLEEQAILVYLLLSQQEAAKNKQTFYGITLNAMEKVLHSYYEVRAVTDFLLRIELIIKKKNDHTFVFKLSRSGQKVSTEIMNDNTLKGKVNAFFLVGGRG